MRKNKEIAELRKKVDGLEYQLHELKGHLETNGVATAINKLNTEVFKTIKPSRYTIYDQFLGTKPDDEATLSGKVDAIIEHLNIDVKALPESKTPAKAVAKKIKKGKK